MLGFAAFVGASAGLPRQVGGPALRAPRARCAGSRDGCRRRTRRQPSQRAAGPVRILGLAKQELARCCSASASLPTPRTPWISRACGSRARPRAAADSRIGSFQGCIRSPSGCSLDLACGSAPCRRRRRSPHPRRLGLGAREVGAAHSLEEGARPRARSGRASCPSPRGACAATS